MNTKELTVHACEQALRFTSVENWNDLTEERKVQLGFNMGLLAMGLGLDKADGYAVLSQAREGIISLPALRQHVENIVQVHGITVNPERIARSF